MSAPPGAPAWVPLGVWPRARAALAGLALAAGLASLLAVALAFGGARAGWIAWDVATRTLLGAVAPGLAAAALLAGAVAVALAWRPMRRASLLAGALGALVGAGVLAGLAARHAALARAALAEPPVHDVATDWRDPLTPTAALVRLRGPAALPVEAAPALAEGPRAGFLGRTVAEVNAATCPQAAPVRLPLTPPQAYARLAAAVRARSWRLVTDDAAGGVLEVVAPAPLAYGAHADVLARVRAEGRGSRIDLRSVSRHGAVDGGSNCRRLGALVAALASGRRATAPTGAPG